MSEISLAMRCAVHSGRAAHDRCPRCDRPRCDADVAAYGDRGCAACTTESSVSRAVSPLEALVTAGQVVVPVAAIGGWIYSQYVEVHVFSWLVPTLIAVAGSSTGILSRQSVPQRRPHGTAIGVLAGLLGTALGFRLFPHGPHDPLRPLSEVGLPYVCTVIAAVVWPIVLGPPRRVDAESEVTTGSDIDPVAR